MRILVIEDHPVNMTLFKTILENAKYEVVCAVDAFEGADMVVAHDYDLILMDIALPGKNGIDLTREIRAGTRNADIPILCITAFPLNGHEQKGLEAGCTEHMLKPIDSHALLDTIKRLIANTDGGISHGHYDKPAI